MVNDLIQQGVHWDDVEVKEVGENLFKGKTGHPYLCRYAVADQSPFLRTRTCTPAFFMGGSRPALPPGDGSGADGNVP